MLMLALLGAASFGLALMMSLPVVVSAQIDSDRPIATPVADQVGAPVATIVTVTELLTVPIVVTETQIITVTVTPTPAARFLPRLDTAPLPELDDVDAAFAAVWEEIQEQQAERAAQGLRYLQMPEIVVDVAGTVFSVECHEYSGPDGLGYIAIVRAAGWQRAAAHGPESRAYEWRLEDVDE